MITLCEFRKNGKLSQAAIGQMLGLTRSYVNIIERGERDMPDAAMERFKKMVEASGQHDTLPLQQQIAAASSQEQLSAAAKKIWQAMLDETTWQQLLLSRRLRRMQEKFAKAVAKSNIHSYAIDGLTLANGAEPEINYFQFQQRAIDKKLIKLDTVPQLRLQLKYDLLLAEEKLLLQYLDPATAPSINDIIAKSKENK